MLVVWIGELRKEALGSLTRRDDCTIRDLIAEHDNEQKKNPRAPVGKFDLLARKNYESQWILYFFKRRGIEVV